MPKGAVVPFEYTKNYVPYDQDDVKRLIMIVRDNKLRMLYEDADLGRYVGVFVFDLTPYDYTGTSQRCLFFDSFFFRWTRWSLYLGPPSVVYELPRRTS